MKQLLRACAIALGAGLIAMPSLAKTSSASVVASSGGAGSVVIVRGTETLSLSPGDELLQGDVIITRASGSVSIAYGDLCTRDLEGLQSITIDSEFCVQELADIDQVEGAPEGSAPQQVGELGEALAPSSPTATLMVLGGVAVAAVAAGASGGGDDQPSSP
jgi:hypothetical protein